MTRLNCIILDIQSTDTSKSIAKKIRKQYTPSDCLGHIWSVAVHLYWKDKWYSIYYPFGISDIADIEWVSKYIWRACVDKAKEYD